MGIAIVPEPADLQAKAAPSMPLAIIDPMTIAKIPECPIACFLAQAHYLGYGRNAWHSKWVNLYMPNCVSEIPRELGKRAEQRRVQGSVFKIESIPMIVLRYENCAFGILPTNEGEKWQYETLLERIGKLEPSSFWQHLPARRENWLLVFSTTDSDIGPSKFLARTLRSRAVGAQSNLNWRVEAGRDHRQFLKFANVLIRRLRKQKKRSEPQSTK